MLELLAENFFVADDGIDRFPVIDFYEDATEGYGFALVCMEAGRHTPHIHQHSDAKCYFVAGQGEILLGSGSTQTKIPFRKGDSYLVPKGTAHGFHVTEPGMFLVWQSKSITDKADRNKRDVVYPEG